MKITKIEVPIRELAEGYSDLDEEGVVAYGGRLNVRPPYQREFVYNDHQRDEVIRTVLENCHLNTFYWSVRDDGSYELLDGQQRTISLCQYLHCLFSIDARYYHNFSDDEKASFGNYKIDVFLCEGTNSEKLAWFQRINIAGEKLNDQELRNAVFAGSWLSEAKKFFSKTNCPAYKLGNGYVAGSPIRQDFLETAIKWISGGKIEEYMAKNQHVPHCRDLWLHFQSVINWVKATFPTYRKEMKGVDFGSLYTVYKDSELDPVDLEKRISSLMMDEDVTRKSGIFSYVLSGDERFLNIRAFSDNQKREAFERQSGICYKCQEKFDLQDMEADHITPWSAGGKTISSNCQLLCKACNRKKGKE